jgi:adenosine deaminase
MERGLSLKDGIEAVARGARDAAATAGVEVRLICTALRMHDPSANERLAREAGRHLDDGLTGWDLAGPEEAFPDPMLHGAAFDIARAAGLRITVHAGEWGGAAQVRRALEVAPERIAHGPGAIDDPDLCRELTARGIALDLCPTSNWQAGIVPSIAAHPLARLHRLGVPVTLSTDDTTVSDLSLTDEYERALDQIGLTVDELWAIDQAALDHAFADDRTLATLRAEFASWSPPSPA